MIQLLQLDSILMDIWTTEVKELSYRLEIDTKIMLFLIPNNQLSKLKHQIPMKQEFSSNFCQSLNFFC